MVALKLTAMVLVVGVFGSAALADMPDTLVPVGNPLFTSSVTQSSWAPVTALSTYVGLRIVAPTDAFIESVSGLGGAVAGSEQYSSTGRLVEGWWVNAPPSGFSVTYELESLLNDPAATHNPDNYIGLRVEAALASANGQITLSRSWVFTNGLSPLQAGVGSGWLPASVNGWYLTDIAVGGSNWHGGRLGAAAAVPAPGAALLGMIGLGIVGWVKRAVA